MSAWRGGVCVEGGCLPGGGVFLEGGGVCLPRGGVPGQVLPPSPVNRMTDRCKNITLANTSFRPVMNLYGVEFYDRRETDEHRKQHGLR